ncbi:MAG: hypothetical protein ACE5I1_21200, partial [bacterium]
RSVHSSSSIRSIETLPVIVQQSSANRQGKTLDAKMGLTQNFSSFFLRHIIFASMKRKFAVKVFFPGISLSASFRKNLF